MNYPETRKPNIGERGLVFNMQKFSLHDGAGIRTLVFFKGCPLTCDWCSNPEGRSRLPELVFNSEKCIGVEECGYCIKACGPGAIVEDSSKIVIDRGVCTACGDCAEACPSRALEIMGESMSVDDVLRVVEEDSAFYARSGGGLTISGGEPLMQAEFVIRLLSAAQARGLDTAIETTGCCGRDEFIKAGGFANHVFCDIKSLDAEKHRARTGVENGPILGNIRALTESFPLKPITIRTPIIPGFNDTPEDVRAIAEFLGGLTGTIEHELLPYHGFGGPKYTQLGRDYQLIDVKPPTEELMALLREAAEAAFHRP
jgi:pyruvate formate lyase activating enzyme